jgi:iron-sulfur cluster assembly protein
MVIYPTNKAPISGAPRIFCKSAYISVSRFEIGHTMNDMTPSPIAPGSVNAGAAAQTPSASAPVASGKPAPRARPKVMTLTPAAVDRVKSIMAAKGPSVAGLKIAVKKGGCAGMEYAISWADSIGKFDDVIDQDGARVIIDPQAVLYLLGTEMDYKVDTLAATFTFNNPNQKSACGCGESVNLVAASKDKLNAVAG